MLYRFKAKGDTGLQGVYSENAANALYVECEKILSTRGEQRDYYYAEETSRAPNNPNFW